MKNKNEVIKKYDATVERIFKIYYCDRSFIGKNDYEKEIVNRLKEGLFYFENTEYDAYCFQLPKYNRCISIKWNVKNKSIVYFIEDCNKVMDKFVKSKSITIVDTAA